MVETLQVRCCGGMVFDDDGCASLCVECFYFASVSPSSACCLMRSTAGAYYRVVDVYNSNTGAWSLAQLSVPRSTVAAISVGSLALFAGGFDGGALLRQRCV
jgi:hypothetical protein